MDVSGVGVDAALPVVLVDVLVVVGAEQCSVCDGGGSALVPGGEVVCFGPAGWSVAAGEGAALVACCEGEALGSGVEALGTSDIQRFAAAVEDHGDDPGAAGHFS